LKTYLLIRQTNWLLHDLKFLLAKNQSANPVKKSQHKICKNCTFRMSYIYISDDVKEDTFYYKCKLHQREIKLGESCTDFKRYITSKRRNG
jgi:hypothetical protein